MVRSFGNIGGEGQEAGDIWDDELAKLKLFPLKIVSKEKGKVHLTQEVTSIEPKTLGAGVFEVPKGYRKQTLELDMEKLMKEMEQMKKKDSTGVPGKDDPGANMELEKMMKQLKEMKTDQKDTSGAG